jgi:hypothetical protein
VSGAQQGKGGEGRRDEGISIASEGKGSVEGEIEKMRSLIEGGVAAAFVSAPLLSLQLLNHTHSHATLIHRLARVTPGLKLELARRALEPRRM